MNILNKLIIYLLILGSVVGASCKKPQPKLSSEKVIKAFYVFTGPYKKTEAFIRNDSIFAKIPDSVSLDSLMVLVDYRGIDISPYSYEALNFTHPKVFTVFAEDGSTRNYTVIISHLNSKKEITAFVFKSSENTHLREDLTGTIEDSTITVLLSSDVDISNLKPAITFNGETISPANGTFTDFSNGATYTVTAEDHTTKTYSVTVSYNKYVYIGSADGYIYALHSATGKVKWKFNTGNPPGDPIYKDGVLYAGCNDGNFYALDGETGALKWKFFNQEARFSAPHVEGGVIYVTFFTASIYSTGIFAINANTGSLLWKTFSPFRGYGVASAPTYSDGIVFIAAYDAGLIALDAATGAIKWRNMVGITLSNPAVVNGTVYINSEQDMLGAYDARTGSLKWSFELLNLKSSFTISDGILYTAGERGYMYAIDVSKGTLVWKTKVSRPEGPIAIDYDESAITALASPAVSDGLVFINDLVSNTYVFNAASGEQKWNYNNNDGIIKKCWSGPVAAHGMVVTDRCDNKLKAFFAKTGKPMWTFTAAGYVNTRPCIVDFSGKAFYNSVSGNVN